MRTSDVLAAVQECRKLGIAVAWNSREISA